MDLDAIKRRRDAATKGPWDTGSWCPPDDGPYVYSEWLDEQKHGELGEDDDLDSTIAVTKTGHMDPRLPVSDELRQQATANAAFIAHSWQDVGDLLAEVERLNGIMVDVRRQLRIECEDLGDQDWNDDLHPSDVIEKHLARPARRRIEMLEDEAKYDAG